MKDIDFINKIKKLRSQKGITQVELAEAIGMPLRTYQRIESAQSSLKIEDLIEIFRFLDLDIFNSIKSTVFSSEEKDQYNFKNIVLKSETIHVYESMIGREIFEIELIKNLLSSKAADVNGKEKPIGYWEYCVTSGRSFWSPEVWSIYGLDKSKDRNLTSEGYEISEWIRINHKLKNLIENGEIFHDIHIYKRPDQKVVRVESTAKRYLLEDSRVLIFGIIELAT